MVCDDNTYRAAGARVEEVLKGAGVPFQLYIVPCRHDRIAPSEWELGSMMMHFDPACDFILGVGSGVINDLCKVFAHASGRKSGIVGTAPSMDGFASNSASMEVNNVKLTLYNASPAFILLEDVYKRQRYQTALHPEAVPPVFKRHESLYTQLSGLSS